mmetsp:Transcript_33999/g.74397  ORF Transcript_33999/g.74397 Transcript_33999/m.74397 type:complete len:308 (+) Transcript_33999:314-1237(+)
MKKTNDYFDTVSKSLDVLAHNLGGRDAQQAAGLAGDGALHQYALVLGVDAHNLQLALLGGLVAHLASSLEAREHAAGGGARAGGTVLAVRLGTVGHQTTLEAPTLDSSLEALAHAGALDVAEITLGEHLGEVKLLTSLVALNGLHPELSQVPEGRSAALGQMAQLGLADVLLLAQAVTDLDGGVAIAVLGLHLGHHVAVVQGDHGHGHRDTLLSENLSHTRLVSHKTNTGLQGVSTHAQGTTTAGGASAHARGHGSAHERGGARLHGGRGAGAGGRGGGGKLHGIADGGAGKCRHGDGGRRSLLWRE